mmetsp:Transcript_11263/g.42178  ORF Transcript_11263/g.42178 Transcript_11263/m.42178 type:complete len:232 (-) Transcript_11263:1087-1782(-)
MLYFTHIASKGRHECENACQISRSIRHSDANTSQTSRAHETTIDNLSKHRNVNISSCKYAAHSLVFQLKLLSEESCHSASSCSLCHCLFLFQQCHDCCCNLVLSDRHNVIDIFLNNGQCFVSHRLHCNTIGKRSHKWYIHNLLLFAARFHTRHVCCLNSKNLDSRINLLQSKSSSSNETTSTNWNNHGVKEWVLFHELNTKSSLTCNNLVIIVWMNKNTVFSVTYLRSSLK